MRTDQHFILRAVLLKYEGLFLAVIIHIYAHIACKRYLVDHLYIHDYPVSNIVSMVTQLMQSSSVFSP